MNDIVKNALEKAVEVFTNNLGIGVTAKYDSNANEKARKICLNALNEIRAIIDQSAQPTPSQRMVDEDVLLALYKIYAYIPNDAEGNPLTPFGNFAEGFKVGRAQLNTKPTNDALDADTIGLVVSREIMNILENGDGHTSRAQLQAKIQCAVIDAIDAAMKEGK